MTRIIAGVAKGRRLRVPSNGTRPTSDRAREALFSSLESLRGPFRGARVLDLYAGSGALGLEARSRGASVVDLVESDGAATRVIEQNIVSVFGEGGEGGEGGENAENAENATGLAAHHSTVERWLR